MYEKYYDLTAPPFQLTPDSRFFYESRAHARAIAHLTFGLAQGEGFVVVTGEVGAGKTTLMERLLSQLDRGTYAIARINTTQVSGDDLFRLAMAASGGCPRCQQVHPAAALRRGAARVSGVRPALPADRRRGAEPVAGRTGGAAHALQHHRPRQFWRRPRQPADHPARPAAVPPHPGEPELDQLRQRCWPRTIWGR